MILEQILSPAMANFIYLIGNEKSKKAAVIDPSYDSRKVMDMAEEQGLKIEFILLTHGHSDHSSELAFFRKNGAKLVAHPESKHKPDISPKDGAAMELGGLGIKVIHTPGHSRDSVCYLAESNLFTGDTLFIGECGRTDLGGGSSRELHRSIFGKLMKLPNSTMVWPGHDYGKKPFATLGEEKKTSYILEERTEDEFVKFMGCP